MLQVQRLGRLPFSFSSLFMISLLFGGSGVSSLALARPVTVMPEDRVQKYLRQIPPVADAALNDILSSDDTIWYDRFSMIPGYQDSFGDNSQLPIGFRPNSIDKVVINLAVPGGHEQIFIRNGMFHFPFGRTGGLDSALNTFVIDFWNAPRSAGKFLPVVWSKWNPNTYTHRYEWMFPVGTTFGELLFIEDGQESYVFEIRTRTRTLTGWTVDVFRPFRTAEDFAKALERRRKTRTDWANSAEITALIEHLRKKDTLVARSLEARNFVGAFPRVDGAVDELPALQDNSILKQTLVGTIFESVKGAVWKDDGRLKAFAPSTKANFSIVPKNFEGSLFEVSDAFCTRCHQDAGRRFKDYYNNIRAYGELWGEDDIFSWHPFESSEFVDSNGRVRNFNYDNRKFRQDFIQAGLLEKYDESKHSSTFYKRLERAWKNYRN